MTTDKTISQDAARKLLEACKQLCAFLASSPEGLRVGSEYEQALIAIEAAEGNQTPSPAKEKKLQHIPYVSKYFDPD